MKSLKSLNVDLHCHSRFSADGVSEPEEIVRMARERGLHGIAITDHNTCECVQYFRDKGLIREDGMPVDGLLIIPGQEITTAAGHLLALGVEVPDVKGIAADEAVRLIHEKGGIAVAPHPFDMFRAGIRENVLDTLNLDGIEVFNAATTFKRFNRRAHEYALDRGLPMTAGSDAHHAEAIGVAYTIVPVAEFSLQGILEGIKRGPMLQERYLSTKDSFRKTWNNVFRLKKKLAKRPQV